MKGRRTNGLRLKAALATHAYRVCAQFVRQMRFDECAVGVAAEDFLQTLLSEIAKRDASVEIEAAGYHVEIPRDLEDALAQTPCN